MQDSVQEKETKTNSPHRVWSRREAPTPDPFRRASGACTCPACFRLTRLALEHAALWGVASLQQHQGAGSEMLIFKFHKLSGRKRGTGTEGSQTSSTKRFTVKIRTDLQQKRKAYFFIVKKKKFEQWSNFPQHKNSNITYSYKLHT